MITRNTDYSIQRLRGLSTDTKPVNVPNGSEFREWTPARSSFSVQRVRNGLSSPVPADPVEVVEYLLSV